MDTSSGPGSTWGRKHGIGLVRNPAGQLVQQMLANSKMSQPDNPLQTPPASVAPRGVAVPADMRWSTQISTGGSTAPQSPSSVKDTRQHAQQTFDRQQQQQHASTDRRDAVQAPAQLQHIHTVVTDMRSVACQPLTAVPLEKRPAAEEATATTTACIDHDDIHLTVPPPRCGLPADLVSAEEEQIAAEAAPFAATQETSTAPPDTRIPAADTSTISTATVIACAANARARRRLRRELGRAPASPYSPFPMLDLGRLIRRRHAATAINAAARGWAARQFLHDMPVEEAEHRERRVAIRQCGEDAAAEARRRKKGQSRAMRRGREACAQAIEQACERPDPLFLVIPEGGAGGTEMLLRWGPRGWLGVIRSPLESRPGDTLAVDSSYVRCFVCAQEEYRLDAASGEYLCLIDFLEAYGRSLEWSRSAIPSFAAGLASATWLPEGSEHWRRGTQSDSAASIVGAERMRDRLPTEPPIEPEDSEA